MKTPQLFEQEVLRLARNRWPSAENSGSEKIAGKERDGVFITEECVHLVECTVSREKDKAQKDLGKLFELYKQFRRTHAEKAIKGWFVTQYEPTADQRACIKDIKGAPDGFFNVVSFAQFQSKLVDSHEYLQLRERHKFGSIYDPKTGNATVDVAYIEVGLNITGDLTPRSTEYIANQCLVGDRFTLLGEYGVGKSMTLRAIFRHLARTHRENKTHLFPIYLNLREHQGQPDPAEILERHGRSIGFPNPSQLVRAWKAGYVTLLLDGFDEVSSQGLQGAWRRLRDARSASMAGLKRLITESPEACGIALAGREHFFDSEEERRKALGQNAAWRNVRLDEFTDDQIRTLIAQFGFTGSIPAWIPARPLLLTTLFAQGLTSEGTQELSAIEDPSLGWNLLLDEVCSREARIEKSGVSGENVRAILEALATLARTKENGVGPLSVDDIVGAFNSECGFSPADEALIVLQRLPGLGRDGSSLDESRAFVDLDFVDACRAGDFARFCLQPFDPKCAGRLAKTRIPLGQIGVGVAAAALETARFSDGNVTAAIKALDRLVISERGATPFDVVNLALKMEKGVSEPMQVNELVIDRFEVDGSRADMAYISFSDCLFSSIELGADVTASCCPKFQKCIIQELDGRISAKDLPAECFSESEVITFLSSAGTTSAALGLDVPPGTRVLMTVLKKLFVQSLSGRQENGLFRGLDGFHQSKVGPVLATLQRHRLITKSERAGNTLWIPVRRLRSRALSMITSPSTSTDAAIVEVRKL